MSDRLPDGYLEMFFEYRTQYDAEPCFTTLAFELDPGGIDVPGTVNGILEAWTAAFKAVTVNEWTIGPGFGLLGQDEEPIKQDGTAAPVDGEVSAAALPDALAWGIRKAALAGGKRGRGRMFVPGTPAGFNRAGGQVTPEGIDELTDAINAFTTAVAGLAPDVVGAVLLHNSAPFEPSPILSLTAAPRLYSLPRRMTG